MKKKLLLTFVGTYLASLGLMIAGDDLVKGYDFTGSSSVTAAKLNQLVDNATPATYRGLVFYTNQAPSASYYKYLWLDPSTTIPGLKVYSTNGGGWSNIVASVSFSQNSIAPGVLQQNAVSTTNIVDSGISTIKIAAGAVTSSKLGLQAVDATNIVNNTITSTQVATNGLATANYADASVTATKLAAGSVGTSNLQSGFLLYGTNIAAGTVTGANIAGATIAPTNLATAPTALYIPRVNGATTGFEWAAPGLVQLVSTSRTDVVTCNNALELDDTIPQNTEGDQVFTLTITPKSATSKLSITFMGIGGANGNANINSALFQDSTANALAASTAYNAVSGNPINIGLRHVMTSGTTSATTFSIRIGTAAAETAYLNANGSGTRMFGGVAASSFTIEEIQ